MIINRLTPPQQAAMRMKIIAFAALKGKKPNWGYNREWQGNYLSHGEHNSNVMPYNESVQRVMEQTGDKRILFSAFALKWSTKVRTTELITIPHIMYRASASNAPLC